MKKKKKRENSNELKYPLDEIIWIFEESGESIVANKLKNYLK